MIAADTNLLVRVLVDDPGAPEQCAAARAAVAREQEVYVTQEVQAELSWVLATAFGFGRTAIALAMKQLRDNMAFHLQRPDSFAAALVLYGESSLGFADCLILAEARSAQAVLLTFDRKLGKQVGATCVG